MPGKAKATPAGAPKVATAAELLGASAPADEVLTLPSGATVRVRALSRRDMLHVIAVGRDAADEAGEDTDAREMAYIVTTEREVIARGLVEPAVTVEEVEAWQDRPGSHPDMSYLADAISTRSRARKADAHAVYKSDGERPDA